MIEKTHQTPCGTIHYWVNKFHHARKTIAFLPGLTADHRLFDKQIEYFKEKYNVFVWNAPGHASSWPFSFDFTLTDKAQWLHEIMQAENATQLVIVGQSMGGYVGQVYANQYPSELEAFISIDSAPLERKYISRLELWLLKRMEPIYRYYPWKALIKSGSRGVAMSEYGRKLMKEMMLIYEGNQERYAKLSGHGFKIVAEAIEADLSYKLPTHSLLICGEKDKAGSCIRYNRAWHKQTGIPLVWIKEAGHNANTDKPEIINSLIEEWINSIE